jgi:hypothetical protein
MSTQSRGPLTLDPLGADRSSALIDYLNKVHLPPLGDDSKRYSEVLTEPEINAIHFVVEFFRSEMQSLSADAGGKKVKVYMHYGPALQALSNRLSRFDDDQSKPQPANVVRSEGDQDEAPQKAKS